MATAVAAPARRSARPWCGSGWRSACCACRCRSRAPARCAHAVAARRLGAGALAGDALALLLALERAWRAARSAMAGRRRHSPAAAAVYILAAAPLVSASSLAAGLGMAVKNAMLLLDDFCAAGIAIEVTQRSKRRLFGLTGLAPLREAVRRCRPCRRSIASRSTTATSPTG